MNAVATCMEHDLIDGRGHEQVVVDVINNDITVTWQPEPDFISKN